MDNIFPAKKVIGIYFAELPEDGKAVMPPAEKMKGILVFIKNTKGVPRPNVIIRPNEIGDNEDDCNQALSQKNSAVSLFCNGEKYFLV